MSIDRNWLIEGNTIEHTGDSGLLLLGSDIVVVDNTVFDTGVVVTKANSNESYRRHALLKFDTENFVPCASNTLMDVSRPARTQATSSSISG